MGMVLTALAIASLVVCGPKGLPLHLAADPIASDLATSYASVAAWSAVTDISKGEVPSGFFKAFFPDESSDGYAKLADRDSDGDGFLNWEEYVLGTDPTNGADAFTLLQGYQHLAAPAAAGDTLQYKVMYAQRARST